MTINFSIFLPNVTQITGPDYDSVLVYFKIARAPRIIRMPSVMVIKRTSSQRSNGNITSAYSVPIHHLRIQPTATVCSPFPELSYVSYVLIQGSPSIIFSFGE